MKVEVFQHEGVTQTREGLKSSIVKGQFRVYVDGIGVGYIGTEPGSKLLLTETRFSKAELAEMGKQVSELMGFDEVEVKQPPKVDPELLKARNDGIQSDDFD